MNLVQKMKHGLVRAKKNVLSIVLIMAIASLPFSSFGTVTAQAASVFDIDGITTFPGGTELPGGQKLVLSKNTYVRIDDRTDGQVIESYTRGDVLKNDVLRMALPREAKTYTDPCTIYFENTRTVGGRSLDVNLIITEIKVHDVTPAANVTDDFYRDKIEFTYITDSAFSFHSDDFAQIDVAYTLEIRYHDTGALVTCPCWQKISDLDVIYPDKNFKESWECNMEDFQELFVWDSCILSADKSGSTVKFSATSEEYDLDGDDSMKKGGVIAAAETGTWGGKFYEAYCATELAPYVSITGTPSKTVTSTGSSDGSYVQGDTVTFSVAYTMGTFYYDMFAYYDAFSIEDAIPDGLTYVDGSAELTSGGEAVTEKDASFSTEDGRLLYTFSRDWLHQKANYAGQGIVMTFDCTVDEVSMDKTITNIATMTLNEDPLYTNEETIDVVTPALRITKSADEPVYSVGDTVTYTITVDQTVPGATARNTVVTDTLPEELSLLSVTTDTGSAATDDNGFTANLGDISADPAEITVTAKALTNAEEITNTAYASADDTDTVSDDAVIEVRQPSLAIQKTADAETYYAGDVVTYTITVTNLKEGESEEENVPTAYNIVVRDTVPEELGLLEVDAPDGTVETSGNDLTVTYPSMYYGEEHTITVTAEAYDVGNQTIENVAFVSSDATEEISDDAAIDILKPILSVEKEADKESYSVGEDIVYTIDVTQTVPELTAEHVVVNDTLPDEVTLADAVLEGVEGVVDMENNHLTADIPSLAFDETARITVTAKAVAPGEGVTNVAYADADHADTEMDEATLDILQPEPAAVEPTAAAPTDPPTPTESASPTSTSGPKTGQSGLDIILGIICCAAAAMIVVIVLRRRRRV